MCCRSRFVAPDERDGRRIERSLNFEQRIPRETSAELFEEAKTYFPGGVNSPVRAFRSVSGPPLFIKEGKGSRMTDEDGNSYLDFCCSWGPLIHGHNNDHIREEVMKTVAKGTSFGTPNRLGNELGKLILDNHPYVDRIRFVSSGTEAVMSALRLARGVTGRSKIIKFDSMTCSQDRVHHFPGFLDGEVGMC